LNSVMRVGFGFSSVTFRPSRVFHSRIFSRPSVDTHEQSTGNCPHFHQTFKMLWQIFMLTMSLYAFISLLYELLKSFTVPSVLLTKFPKKFHAKLFTSAFIFTKLSTKTLCFDAAVFHLSIKGYCKTRPRRSYCFLSIFKLRCKRHYRNLATYSWYTTWREHVTKTAPARRRHAVGDGAPIS